jgi:hypothetical protein
VLTTSARRTPRDPHDTTVTSLDDLLAAGWTHSAIRSQLAARRWRRVGSAILLHNAEPSTAERHDVVLANSGPRCAFTAFTAAESWGLDGWERDVTHVLVPGGTHVPTFAGFPRRVHYVGRWRPDSIVPGRRLHRPAEALMIAAATFERGRPACGVLAAGVQQRVVTADQLDEALARHSRLRHRRLLLGAVRDIAQGAEALSEIDFARLCRRYRLPAPQRQVVRCDRDGRRRYVDAEWTRRDGQRVVVEVDGALHLAPRRWWDDQLRQNELVLGGSLLLRFPSVVLRTEPDLVATQLAAVLR